MIIRKGYRFLLKPTAKQAALFSRFVGCSRFVWNKALELQKAQIESKHAVLTYSKICAPLKQWKDELTFLKEVHSQPLQQSLKDLCAAFEQFFSGAKGYPKFKKRGKQDSFRFPQGTKVEDNKVYLPKIGWVVFKKSQEIDGTIKNVTVSRSNDRWFVSFQVEMEVAEPVHPSNTEIGIDLGVTRFATLSDGTFIAPINSLGAAKARLARAQRRLSKKQKYSKNWIKQKRKIQRIHSKISNTRRDFLHKSTSLISQNHAIIILEDLRVKNMSASAKGTIREPGKNVKAKSGLNRAILDQGWYEFRRQREYKQQWKGGRVVAVKPAYTSIECSECHHREKESRRTQSEFRCVNCAHEEHADLNAAKNILAAGRAVNACGDIKQNAA
jgi:putative transposase